MVFIRNYHGRSLISIMTDRIFIHRLKNLPLCLPSRRFEVEQARERKTRVSRSRAPVLSCAHQFHAPATQASCLWKSSTISTVITFRCNWILYFLSFFHRYLLSQLSYVLIPLEERTRMFWCTGCLGFSPKLFYLNEYFIDWYSQRS